MNKTDKSLSAYCTFIPFNNQIVIRDKIEKSTGGSGIYGPGLIGALIYYLSTATSFWIGVWGVFKAIV